MKFIHCADLHLDSKMECNLSAEKAKERNAEICATFARMVRYAVENGVTAVLLAGDLFDTRRASARTAGFVLDRIREAGDVDFLYLRGNHDECENLFFGLKMPDNFKTFGPAWRYYRYGTTVVAGVELNRENCISLYGDLDLSPEDTNLVMLHGQTATQPGEDTVALPRLVGKHIHYLALGHLHSYQTGPLDDEGIYCYSGCLEGRGFDECGEKGFVLLDAADHQVRQTFVPFASRTMLEIPVDLTNLVTVNQILSAMERASENVSSRCLVKFTLTGQFAPETQKDLRFLEKMLESRFYFVKIKDESRLKIERAAYEHDVSLKGEFIRMVLSSDKSREEQARMINWGIQALSGEEVTL